MMVHRTPFFLPLLYPSLTWRISTESKEMYLTFDDGPVPGPTEFVLETLDKFGVKATFFCIGDNIRKHPDVFNAVVNGGHKIGNHTFNHLNGWRTESTAYLENVAQCNKQIAEHSGVIPMTTIFRPPYGRITREQIRLLTNFKIVMWDVLAVDYSSTLSCARCLQNTINASRTGSIVVFHDSYKAEKNLTYVLPKYIEHFLTLGFEFKVIPG